MSATIFVDTSVLVYARDASEPHKQRRAAEWMAALWSSKRGRTGTQVLQEYYVIATRELDPPRARGDVREDIEALRAWRPVGIGYSTFDLGWEIEDRFGFSWWDALIVAAAIEAGSRILLTEDLQDGQEIEGVRILNPFLHDPETVLAATR